MFDPSRYPRSAFFIDTAIGVALCGIVAAVLSLVMGDVAGKPLLPLIFIVVIVAAALRYGLLSAILGAVLATVIFAYFLFVPVGSFKVQKGQARTNLSWMFMVGIPAAYFAWSTKVAARDMRAGEKLNQPPPNEPESFPATTPAHPASSQNLAAASHGEARDHHSAPSN
jgi:K+-sensing histidine kinase KdpD